MLDRPVLRLKGVPRRMINPPIPEHVIQKNFVIWTKMQETRYPELRLGFAIPNGGQRHFRVAVRMRAEGVRSGVLDWNLPVARGGYIGLWIEFKTGRNDLTKNQNEYRELLISEGHKVVVAYDTETAIKAVQEYLKNRREIERS